ncbi:MAG: hypothetical protein FWG78_03290 [Coriobacteriia bacterium]|nr:hypothetical protein [Coriobacteriia bacterium]
MRILLLTISLVLAFTPLTLVACSPQLEAVEAMRTAELDAPVNGMLAEGHPRAVPLWAGATVVMSDRIMRHDFDVYDLVLVSDDPFKMVLDGYIVALQREGFNVTQRDIDARMTSVIATNTAYDATFTFTTNVDNRTEIITSIRIHHLR